MARSFSITGVLGLKGFQFHRGMRAAEDSATAMARNSARSFRQAFTTFFSVSALKNLVVGTWEWAKNFENVRDEIRLMGIQIDESIIKKAQQSAASWDIFMAHLRVGFAQMMPALSGFFSWIAQKAAGVGAFWGAFGVDAPTTKVIPSSAPPGSWGAFPTIVKEGGKPIAERLKAGVKAMEDAEADIAKSFENAGRLADQRVRDLLDKIEKQNKVAEKKAPLPPSAVAGSKDPLAAIGGFGMGSHLDAIKNISRQQLNRLEKIEVNTDRMASDAPI